MSIKRRPTSHVIVSKFVKRTMSATDPPNLRLFVSDIYCIFLFSTYMQAHDAVIVAEYVIVRGNVAELFPCSSCEEIQKLNPRACSGQYVIKGTDGSLEQASVYIL